MVCSRMNTKIIFSLLSVVGLLFEPTHVYATAEIIAINTVITFVDIEGKNIKISDNGKPQAKEIDLELGRKTKVLIAGKEAQIEVVRPGQKATVYYDPQLELVTKIEIAVLFVPEPKPLPAAQRDGNGFEPLLPKEGLEGWYFKEEPQYYSQNRNSTQRKPNWENKNGILMYRYAGPSLVSDQKFDDFELELDFNLPRECNCGVFLRGRYEVKLTDTQRGWANLKPDGRIGAIFSKIPPSKITYKGPYVWNKLEVKLVGQTVTVKINGETVINEKEIEGQLVGPVVDADEGAPGPIMFFAHPKGIGARFRNVKIKPLER
jgi:hypothetical protein